MAIRGKVRNFIYESDSGYKVGLFRVKWTDDEILQDMVNKTITFTGVFADLNYEDNYVFNGNYINHDRYGYQFSVINYERLEPEGKDAIVEFLSSSLIKGCGEKTAMAIVETLGDDAITKIKENANNLLLVPGITSQKATKIYDSILKYSLTDDIIIALKTKGFTNNEALNMIKLQGDKTLPMVEENIYEFTSVVDFKKLDTIYLKEGDVNDEVRVRASIIHSLKRLEFQNGDTYFSMEEIASDLQHTYQIFTNSLDKIVDDLCLELKLRKQDNKIFLFETFEMEENIAENLYKIENSSKQKIVRLDEKIKEIENLYSVSYNKDQKEAIKSALNNNITIITGGPGTGKTTIIKAIVELYINEMRLDGPSIGASIALLAPTGRASRKMMETANVPASTIHRFLKWNKEANDFGVNEYNKNYHKLIIVDEVSMIDTMLFSSLLKGLTSNIKLVLVGDVNQLPSVSAGNVLDDLINSNLFTYVPLEQIYRQSKNSYIPDLCREIRTKNLSEDFLAKKDDYNFLKVDSNKIRETIVKICEMSLEKGLNEKDVQILAPMYKGENGIDNLNISLQNLFNPDAKEKREAKIFDTVYREGDKVIQLVNDPDNNVFNGDIGYIYSIAKTSDRDKDVFTIDFEGNRILYKKEDMGMIRHAYAMSIHKSQGSEFNHVIIPVTKSYYRMLYNKLIYTGVSRAKKSLVIIGSPEMFGLATNNDYANNRKTDLKEKLANIFAF